MFDVVVVARVVSVSLYFQQSIVKLEKSIVSCASLRPIATISCVLGYPG
jgi:hypothetical protein